MDDDYYIYQIQLNDYLYIGSTKNIKMRQNKHNSNIKNGCEYPLYRYCRENDINRVELIEIERVPLWERYKAEQYYIDEFRTGHKLLNSQNAFFDEKLYYQAYRQANRDIIAEKTKAYRKANKDIIAEKKRTYRQANKDRLLERDRAYRQANKQKIAEYQRAYRAAKKHNN